MYEKYFSYTLVLEINAHKEKKYFSIKYITVTGDY